MMTQVVLGRTGLVVNKNGFGCLPIQRISREEAAGLLRCAYENGINFFDTARSYTDSEEKKSGTPCTTYGITLLLATKTPSKTPEGFWERFGNKFIPFADRPY